VCLDTSILAKINMGRREYNSIVWSLIVAKDFLKLDRKSFNFKLNFEEKCCYIISIFCKF
jgi:hypothetical protein